MSQALQVASPVFLTLSVQENRACTDYTVLNGSCTWRSSCSGRSGYRYLIVSSSKSTGIKCKIFLTGASGGIGLDSWDSSLISWSVISITIKHVSGEPLTLKKLKLEQGAIVTAHFNSNSILKPLRIEPLHGNSPGNLKAVKADLRIEDDVFKLYKSAQHIFGSVQIIIVNHAISVESKMNTYGKCLWTAGGQPLTLTLL